MTNEQMTNEQMTNAIHELRGQLHRVAGRAAALEEMVKIMIENEERGAVKAAYSLKAEELLAANPINEPDLFKGIHETVKRLS